MLARANAYYTAQMLSSILPGVEFDLIKGFQKLSQLNKNFTLFDSDLNMSVLEEIPSELRVLWKQFTSP